MDTNKLFIKPKLSNRIVVLDFSRISSYSVHASDNRFILHVKIANVDTTYDISDILTDLPSVSTSTGIYYDIKQVCQALHKDKRQDGLPSWVL